MHFVVTGAAGFIGSNIVKALNAVGERDILAALRDREWLVQAWADRMLVTGPAGPVCVDLEWLGRGWADRMPVTGPTE